MLFVQEAIALNNKDFESTMCRSWIYFEKFEGLVDNDANADLASHVLLQALQDADDAITLRPDHEGGYLCKISILRSIQEITAAKALCEEAMRRVPKCESLIIAANALQGETDYDEAAEFRKILEDGLKESHSHDHDHSHSHSHDHGNHDHPVDCECPQHSSDGKAVKTTKGKGKAKIKSKQSKKHKKK